MGRPSSHYCLDMRNRTHSECSHCLIVSSSVFLCRMLLPLCVYRTILTCALYHITRWTECTTAPCFDLDHRRNTNTALTLIQLHSLNPKPFPSRHGLNPFEVDWHGARSQGRAAVATHRTSLVPPLDPNGPRRGHAHTATCPTLTTRSPTHPDPTTPYRPAHRATTPHEAATRCATMQRARTGPSRQQQRGMANATLRTLALYPTECEPLNCACESLCVLVQSGVMFWSELEWREVELPCTVGYCNPLHVASFYHITRWTECTTAPCFDLDHLRNTTAFPIP